MIVAIEPVNDARIVCYYRDSNSSNPKGKVVYQASDQGFSFTMPCEPEWSDSAGRKAVLQYDDHDTATLEIITAEGATESATSVACSTFDTR